MKPMEIYSTPVSAKFDAAMVMAEKLHITTIIELAAQCKVIYNPLLASKLLRYEILEAIWSEGDFNKMYNLLERSLAENSSN